MPDRETDALDIAPFDLLNQKEQWSHLQRWHRETWKLSNGSKTSKSDMTEWHMNAHLTGTSIGKDHTHTAVPPKTGDVKTEGLGGLNLSQPLNASQRKNLKELVENDFLALRAEINQFADDMARQKRGEIERDYKARGADSTTFMAKARDLAKAYRNGADALVLEARQAGVEIKVPEIYSRDVEVKVSGLSSALREAEAEVDADRRRALNTLERARLTAQRRVLMTGVTEEALAILDTIPNAHTLMVEAAAQRAGTQPSVTA